MKLLELFKVNEIAKDALIDRFGEDTFKLLLENRIGEYSNNKIIFAREDRLKLAILALKEGIDIKEVAKVLSWRDFEYFASIILMEHGYKVYNSIRIDRFEIDILAVDDLALAIDCKHWKYNSNSRLINAIIKQIERCRLLLKSKRFDIKYIMPIILTLYPSIMIIDSVPIVPIEKFDNFLLEFKGYMDMLLIIR